MGSVAHRFQFKAYILFGLLLVDGILNGLADFQDDTMMLAFTGYEN